MVRFAWLMVLAGSSTCILFLPRSTITSTTTSTAMVSVRKPSTNAQASGTTIENSAENVSPTQMNSSVTAWRAR